MTEPSRPIPPSGSQLEISLGDQRATVVEVGGALRAYGIGERRILDGYAADEMCSAARGQSLIPWPNRLGDGRYTFRGTEYQLPLSEPEKRNAIHGLVRWASWSVGERDESRLTMEHVLHPQPGYPFALGLAIEYELSDAGLAVRTTATNLGSEPCPYGAGAHPYLTVGTETVDPVVVRAPGRRRLRSDDRGLPAGWEPVAGSEYDFTSPREIGGTVLDTGYGDLDRDDDGRARVELRAPGGESAALWLDESYGYLMLFTGDPLPEVNRRSLGIEPMTCAPDAFRTGEGLLTLEPGETFTSAWGIEPTAPTLG